MRTEFSFAMPDYNPGYTAFLNLYLHLCNKYICTKYKEDKNIKKIPVFFSLLFSHSESEDFETRKALTEDVTE